MENKKVPQLRFNAFEDDWEEKKLGEIVTEVKRKTDENSNAPIMMISASEGFINQSEKYSSDNAGSSLKNYTLLKKGELSYNHGYSKLRNFGSCFALECEEARIPFVYHSFALKNDDSNFFGKYLNCGIFDNELKKRVASTARMDGLLNISFDEYVSLIIKKPSKLEQQKIGSFLSHIDSLIQAKTKKLESLKSVKKSLLQKCFPKDGEKVPQMRFEGFSGEWEEKKLGEECEIIAGGDVNNLKLKKDGKYPVIANSITTDGILGYYDFDYRVEAPAITVTGRGDVGFAKTRKQNFTPVVRLLALKTKNDVDFLSNAINLQRVIIESTGVPQLTVPQLADYRIKFSTLVEQQKIGQFFSKYGSLISLQQKEIDNLKTIKKSLLQKMFV